MTKESSNKKNLIIGICAAVIIIILIILAIIFGTRNGGLGGLNDAYFKSDGSKYVLTIDSDEMYYDYDNGEIEHKPLKTHLVYYYSGDKITSLKAFYEYGNEEDAKKAFEYYSANQGDSYKNIEVDGKYLILETKESEYEGVTPSDVKQQIDFIESLKGTNDTTEEVIEVEETIDAEDTTETEEVVEEQITE